MMAALYKASFSCLKPLRVNQTYMFIRHVGTTTVIIAMSFATEPVVPKFMESCKIVTPNPMHHEMHAAILAAFKP